MNHGENSGKINGQVGALYIPPVAEMMAFDRLPTAIRQFLERTSFKVSAVTSEHRLIGFHRGNVDAWIREAQQLFPGFRDGVTAAAWGKDHPSIGGPILETEQHGRPISRRPARRGARPGA